MKIDEMLIREDFNGILIETLNTHFLKIKSEIVITNSKQRNSNELLTYDKLNAIISRNPSKQVISYLNTEYTVGGALFRRLLIKAYLSVALHTKGILAKKFKFYLKGLEKNNINHILIYPCNKKIRIFNFIVNEIDVIAKVGFPKDAIKKEIEFRIKNISLHIEPIIDFGENWYRERIIDGTPLARIKNLSDKYIYFKKKSLELLYSITDSYKRIVKATDYVKETIKNINRRTETIIELVPSIKNTLVQIENILADKLSGFDIDITLTLSHGDFHHGNIWLEEKRNNIIIIDWETYDTRSEWYDVVTLYGGLRETNGINQLINNIFSSENQHLSLLIGKENIDRKLFLVLLEDILFRVDDLYSSPLEIGCIEFQVYCKMMLNNLSINNL
jgi:hypothetical protein